MGCARPTRLVPFRFDARAPPPPRAARRRSPGAGIIRETACTRRDRASACNFGRATRPVSLATHHSARAQ
eukprot:scaffold251130_cov35-Tisochrysis_lutea.AAC.1